MASLEILQRSAWSGINGLPVGTVLYKVDWTFQELRKTTNCLCDMDKKCGADKWLGSFQLIAINQFPQRLG